MKFAASVNVLLDLTSVSLKFQINLEPKSQVLSISATVVAKVPIRVIFFGSVRSSRCDSHNVTFVALFFVLSQLS